MIGPFGILPGVRVFEKRTFGYSSLRDRVEPSGSREFRVLMQRHFAAAALAGKRCRAMGVFEVGYKASKRQRLERVRQAADDVYRSIGAADLAHGNVGGSRGLVELRISGETQLAPWLISRSFSAARRTHAKAVIYEQGVGDCIQSPRDEGGCS